ncbi:MAG: RsmB/NOP family class I SAM-dependent RNA methyltransferase [Acetobacterales bacterium]
MTPAARLQAAIALLDLLEADRFRQPADAVLAGWFRRRRYAGGGDRRAIGDRVFDMLRHRGRLRAALEAAGAPQPDGRAVALAHLLLVEGTEDAAAAFAAGGYGPAPLTEDERALAGRLAALRPGPPDSWTSSLPDWARREHPAWMAPHLAHRFGDSIDAEMAALARPAPVDLRVNTLKADRATALAALAADGIEAAPTPLARTGLRLAGRADLRSAGAFRDGLVDVQDESSQVCAALVDAAPGTAVCDFCAGAGGKTLALGAAMAGRGRLVACDADAGRLSRMAARRARAGLGGVEAVALDGDNAWIAANAGLFDRVLVDAPCGGSGTWRRAPETRWRRADEAADDAGGPAALAAMAATQSAILARAAALVRPGGRLVYATCSLLPPENEGVVDGFLAAAPDFRPLDPVPIWSERVDGPCPSSDTFILMSPYRTGTDGFFVAILERARDA